MSFKKLGDIAKIRRGASPRPIDDPKYFGGEVGWVRISDVSASNKYLRKTTQYVSELGEKNSIRVNKGDLILSICGTVGKPIIIDIPACIHDGFVQIYDLKESNSEFLYYVLQNSEERLKGQGQSGTQTNLNTSLVGDLEIFHPSLDEQTAIAELLGEIDFAIEQTQKLIEKQKRIKQGLMRDLLTKGIDEHGNIRNEKTHRFKDSPLGKIPQEWKFISLGKVGNWLSGGTPSKSQSRFWNGTIPWISSKDMKQFFLKKFSDFLTEEGANNGTRIVPKDTILIVVRGMVLAHTFPVGVTTQDIAFNQDLKACVCSEQVLPLFFAYILLSKASKLLQLTSAATHGTKRIDTGDLFDFEIAIPSDKNEQELIVKIIENFDNKINAEVKKHEKLKVIKKGLMQDLLVGKKSVKDLIEI